MLSCECSYGFIFLFLFLHISGGLSPLVSVGVDTEYKLAFYGLTLSEGYCVRIAILYPYGRIA